MLHEHLSRYISTGFEMVVSEPLSGKRFLLLSDQALFADQLAVDLGRFGAIITRSNQAIRDDRDFSVITREISLDKPDIVLIDISPYRPLLTRPWGTEWLRNLANLTQDHTIPVAVRDNIRIESVQNLAQEFTKQNLHLIGFGNLENAKVLNRLRDLCVLSVRRPEASSPSIKR